MRVINPEKLSRTVLKISEKASYLSLFNEKACQYSKKICPEKGKQHFAGM